MTGRRDISNLAVGMALAVDAAATATRAAAPARGDGAGLSHGLRRPGWPVALLFVGYPLWWALGIADVVGLVAAGAMVAALVRRGRVRVPAGFGMVLLFLVWIALSFVLIQVAVPQTVSAADSNRYLTASWRLLWYLKAVVLLLYLGNERERLSETWICRTLGWMFVYVTAGGLLGVLAPSFEFRSFAERLLPAGLATTPFVYANIHPVAAERFADYLGGAHRPSAPFPYANIWGLNFACFLPFFVIGWLSGSATRRRRAVGWGVLAVSVVPAVMSLNRGLWLALAAAAVLLAVRAAIAGNLRTLALLVSGAAVLAAVLMSSPLGSSVTQRLSGSEPTSAHTRSRLTSITLSSVRDESPLLGFGATRNLQGNFTSIAGGATTTCRRCSPPALGTQGQLLLVAFTQGLVGVVLYFGFLLAQFVRHLATPAKYATAGLAVLLAHFVTSAVYSADNFAILAIFSAVALLWRAGAPQPASRRSDGRFRLYEPLLTDYATALRRRWRALVVVVLACALAGAGMAIRAGPVYLATVSAYVPDDPTYPAPSLAPLPTSLDAVAREAVSSSSVAAMQRAAAPAAPARRTRLHVTATPNSRILHVTYAAADPDVARRVVAAAVDATLRLHARDLETQQRRVVATLDDKLGGLDAALNGIAVAAEHARQPAAVRSQQLDLSAQLHNTLADLAGVQLLPVAAGHRLGRASVAISRDRQLLDVANGLAIGLIAAAAVLLLGARSVSARRRWPLVAAAVLVFAAGGTALAGLTHASYTSRVELALQPLPGAPLSAASRSTTQITTAMNTEALSARSAAVVREVARRLKQQPDVAASAIGTHVVSNTTNLVLEYTASRAGEARRGAAVLADAFLRARATAARHLLAAQAHRASAELNLAARRLAAAPTRRSALIAYASQMDVFRPQLGELRAAEVQPGRILAQPTRLATAGSRRVLSYGLLGAALGLAFARGLLLARGRRGTDAADEV